MNFYSKEGDGIHNLMESAFEFSCDNILHFHILLHLQVLKAHYNYSRIAELITEKSYEQCQQQTLYFLSELIISVIHASALACRSSLKSRFSQWKLNLSVAVKAGKVSLFQSLPFWPFSPRSSGVFSWGRLVLNGSCKKQRMIFISTHAKQTALAHLTVCSKLCMAGWSREWGWIHYWVVTAEEFG